MKARSTAEQITAWFEQRYAPATRAPSTPTIDPEQILADEFPYYPRRVIKAVAQILVHRHGPDFIKLAP